MAFKLIGRCGGQLRTVGGGVGESRIDRASVEASRVVEGGAGAQAFRCWTGPRAWEAWSDVNKGMGTSIRHREIGDSA